MDQATLSGLIKSFGAADTPENTNRIREFYASDPTAADRRLFGAKGQSDESGGSRDMILNSMLDKALGLASNNVPQSVESTTVPVMDTVKNATLPTKRSATAARPTDWTNASENPNLGPVPARNASAGESGAAPQSGNPLDWLIPLLLGGAATGTMLRSPPSTTQKASPRAIDNEGKLIEGANPSQKQLTYQPSQLDNTVQDQLRAEESRRPINTNTDERNSEVKNKPVNMDTKPQVQGPYDGTPMNVQDQMLEQSKRMKSARRAATGRK